MGWSQRYDCFETTVSRGKAKRRITAQAHAKNNNCGRAVLFQPRCSRIDGGETFEIGSIVNPCRRPAHFWSLDQKASVGDGDGELLQLGGSAMLAMHHRDANGLAVRRGGEHKTADDEANRFSSHLASQFRRSKSPAPVWILLCRRGGRIA